MISWSEIEAECGDYREGFVAVFRRYEGQLTDEKDAQNRTVKVTASSFARHAGIPKATFREWIRRAAGVPVPKNHGEGTRDSRGARAVLRDAPLEQIEQIISELPADRQQAIAAAAGNRYAQARQDYDEGEARLTPVQRREREAGRQATTEAVGRMMTGINAAAIANNLGLCTETLREMIETHSVTEESITTIETALDEFVGELRVARAMAGLDPEREAV